MANDIVFTPNRVAKDIVRYFDTEYDITGKVLDPFKGDGVFYRNFLYCVAGSVKNSYCGYDITEGHDFFEEHRKFDWIVSNPPYSTFTKVLEHSMELADNIVYLIPVNKITSSAGRVRRILEWGGIPEIRIYEPKDCGFPFGFALGAVYLKRGYRGDTRWSFGLNKESDKADKETATRCGTREELGYHYVETRTCLDCAHMFAVHFMDFCGLMPDNDNRVWDRYVCREWKERDEGTHLET
jgi:hypothetical protein